jgi:hypothetical protein
MWLHNKNVFTSKECCLLFSEGNSKDVKLFCAHRENTHWGWCVHVAALHTFTVSALDGKSLVSFVDGVGNWRLCSHYCLYKSGYVTSITDERNRFSAFWSCSVSVRHVKLKTIQGCSQVEVLQQLEKISTGMCAIIPLMCKSVFVNCKEFLGLLPKPLYLSFTYIVVWCEHAAFEGFFNGPEMWKLYELSLGCMQDIPSTSCHSMPFVWSWALCPTGPLLCSRMMPSVSLSRPLLLDLVCRFWSIWW